MATAENVFPIRLSNEAEKQANQAGLVVVGDRAALNALAIANQALLPDNFFVELQSPYELLPVHSKPSQHLAHVHHNRPTSIAIPFDVSYTEDELNEQLAIALRYHPHINTVARRELRLRERCKKAGIASITGGIAVAGIATTEIIHSTYQQVGVGIFAVGLALAGIGRQYYPNRQPPDLSQMPPPIRFCYWR